MTDIQKTRIIELPDATSLRGGYTVADDGVKTSKVSLEFLESAASGHLGWYGVERDSSIANSACTRIGKHELHVALPIQNRMRRCLLRDDGTVRYYLHPNDSSKTDTGMPADLSGAQGQVMVEIPEHYCRFETEGTISRVKFSEFPIPGFHKVQKCYVSAYEASVQRSTNKLSSVVNLSADYRGGGNQSGWDGTFRTQLGRPATNISLTNFRTYARNRGAAWNCYVYDVHKTVTWLYFVEYANLNCQLEFNPSLNINGYRQGGLGQGVTNMSNWDLFGYYPVIPCGTTNSLGNKSGVISYIVNKNDEGTNQQVLNVPSYRGIENPFGHVWKWMDGCKCRIQADGAGGLSEFYVCDNPSAFQSDNYDGYVLRGVLPREEGYVKRVMAGEWGDIMPAETGGSSVTYFSDYYYTSIPGSGESQRGVLVGGLAHDGASAGLVYALTNNAPSNALATIGSRLCFSPA